MFGLIIGTLSLMGLIHMLRKGRHALHGGCHGRRHGPHRCGPRFLHYMFERLDTSPGQEKEIRNAVRELMDEAWTLRSEMGASKKAASEAFREDVFIDAPLDALFAEQDEKITKVREKLKSTLRRAHDALDDEQRAELSSWMKRWGGRFEGRRAQWGPYR